MKRGEILVYDDVGPAWRRRVLVKRAGEPVAWEDWIGQVPEISREELDIKIFELGKVPLQWHFLKLEWPVREPVHMAPMVPLSPKATSPQILADIGGIEVEARTLLPEMESQRLGIGGVAWTLADGQRISGGVREAAECYWGFFRRWPRMAVIWPKPGIPPYLELTSINEIFTLKLAQANWVRPGCLVVI